MWDLVTTASERTELRVRLDAARPIRRVVEAVRHITPSEVNALSDEALADQVLSLERAAASLDACRARTQAALDARGHTDAVHGMRTGSWIARETKTPAKDAKRRVTVARRLVEEYPGLLAALAEGQLSWFHAEAFCAAANPRIARLMGLLIPTFLDLARAMRFDPWCKEVRRAAARLDVDGADQTVGDDNKVFLTRRMDGVRELAGRLGGVDGAAFQEILDAETDRQYRLAKDLARQTDGETEIPTRAQLRAAALMELIRRGHAAKQGGSTAVELTLARHSHDQCGCGDRPTTDPIATARALTDELFESTYGDLFRFWQLETVFCDPIVAIADLQLAGLDGTELDLRLGRSQRLASPAQRRAAFLRDGCCVFPGCDVPVRWCDLHHVDQWECGGCTNIENLACLCRYHHGVTHRQGWSMTAVGDGTFTWTSPTGRILSSQQHGVIRGGPARAGP